MTDITKQAPCGIRTARADLGILRGGGGGGVRVQVRGDFHILTSKKKKKTPGGGGKPLTPLDPPLDSDTKTLTTLSS